jgi:hypothetical protein
MRKPMKTILLAALLAGTVPALAEDTRLSADPQGLSRQLSQVDTAYRRGCLSRRERDEVWDAVESYAEVVDMDWERIRRNAKSFRSGRDNCATANGILRNSRIFSSTAE